jgi:flagellar biosynthesis protein FlhG
MVIAVVSGKGGVGKSVVAVNLAERIAASGERVALIDTDLAQGACSILLNETPAASLTDVSSGKVSFEDVFHETSAGITLVESARDIADIPQRNERLFEVLDLTLEHLRSDHPVIIIDCPAGAGDAVLWALDRADTALLVIVEEPTAIADAYRIVKHLRSVGSDMPLHLVVNHADSGRDAAGVAERFGAITTRFTGSCPSLCGWVPFSEQVRTSVKQQVPAVRVASSIAESFGQIAATLGLLSSAEIGRNRSILSTPA